MEISKEVVTGELAALGWQPAVIADEPDAWAFEDPSRALQLTIRINPHREYYAIVESSFFWLGTRKRYPSPATVHERHADGRAAAEVLREELRFLWSRHGIRRITTLLHRKSIGVHSRGGKQHVMKDEFYIGFKAP